MFEILYQSPLLKGLKPDEVENLIGKINHQIREFAYKEVIAFAGEKVKKAIILMKGKLQGEMLDFSGNKLKIEEIEPPHMIAAAFLYGPNDTFPVNLTALSEGKMLIIYKPDFTRMLTEDTRVLSNYLNIVSGKAQFLSQKITFLSLKTIREKMAYFLLQRENDHVVQLDQNQTQIAELMGVARPSLARTIGELEEDRIIKWERNIVQILNVNKLKWILGK